MNVGQADYSSDDTEPGPRWKAIGGALAILFILGVAFAISRSAETDPANSELARRIRERRERAAQPQVVYVPVPTTVTAPNPSAEPTVIEVPASPDASSPEPTAALVEPSIPRAGTEVVHAPPQESEIDVKRRNGIVEFDQSMAALASKADQADVAWERYLEGCRLNVTTSVAAAGVADRNWIAFAYASTTTSQWTDACAEAGTFYGLVRQVRNGMCVAEDRARMAWVLPGTRRELRSKYRLGWDGWDRVCNT